MSTFDAPEPPTVADTVDGRYFIWRFTMSDDFEAADLIRFPCPARVVTQTLLYLVDSADPTGTTFTPEIGMVDAFDPDGINGGPVSPSSDAPSKSQDPVALDLVNGAMWLRPVPSGTVSGGNLDVLCTLREGHRV